MSFFDTTVAGILKDFYKTVEKLDTHAEAKAQEVADCDEKILEYKDKLLTAAAEMDKARRVSDKIKALVAE